MINNPSYAERAEIVREKGTNRSQFFRGQVDKYSWVDIGSSYLPGELIAAFLWAQMEEAVAITSDRMEIWDNYHNAFYNLEVSGRIRRPIIPERCGHNAHMYYLLLEDLDGRSRFIHSMKERKINCVFHYIPLHSSSFAENQQFPRRSLPISTAMSERLVRMPLWLNLKPSLETIISATYDNLGLKTLFPLSL